MIKNTKRPIIFPLSNPTTNCEATPQKIYQVSKGNAVVATGSPFASFNYKGKTINIGQGNNFFIFPGVGFGAILSKGKYISDAVFTNAAYELANITPKNLLKNETVYPSITNIREISAKLAYVTMQQISEDQGTDVLTLDEIKSRMWKPQYHPILRI